MAKLNWEKAARQERVGRTAWETKPATKSQIRFVRELSQELAFPHKRPRNRKEASETIAHLLAVRSAKRG